MGKIFCKGNLDHNVHDVRNIGKIIYWRNSS